MKYKTLFLLSFFALIGIPVNSLGAEMRVKADGVGFMIGGDRAAARDRAIRDAQVRALEQAMGIEIDARTALH